ncbi:MAG: 1-acyl-sn-glycerol-3-phosphate acyltransferase [Saprospiraceae bacterium]|nr:1-acyl-sn-glycerol-3-phosphate acyltransferase [Saprospiraceae bacterium]
MVSHLSRFILRLWGWKVSGDVGNALPKKIYAVVPHTSAWDFVLGLLLRSAYRIRVNFVGKHTLFTPPLGWLMRWLGGTPIDRSRSQNTVASIAEVFQEHDSFALAIAPEGTRKKVTKLKTGFYHIARMAQIPIVLVRFDFGSKLVTFSEPFYPTEDQTADFAFFHRFYSGASGYHPSLSFVPQ